MAHEGSTRSLATNRQHRLTWCLARPSMTRPMFPRETRSTRMAAATRMDSVLTWDSRRQPVQTETTHAIASVRRMIDPFQSIVPGWPTRARDGGLGLFYAPAEKHPRKGG